MLKNASFRHGQQGVVLFLALVVLVAMLLSGLALFRSVDSGVLVAGNIAMQKSATRQGDQGTEAAVTWLAANVAGAVIFDNASGYVANGLNDVPGSTQTWATWWDGYVVTHPPTTLAADSATGNTVSYLIQRLCRAAGAPYTSGVECLGPPEASGTGSSKGGGVVALNRASSVYYRITSRIVGPRNTVSFVQTIVSI